MARKRIGTKNAPEQPEEQSGIKMPTNTQGITGGIDELIKVLEVPNMASSFAKAMCGLSDAKTWSEIKGKVKPDKSIYSFTEAVSTNTAAILKEVKEITKKFVENDYEMPLLVNISNTLDTFAKDTKDYLNAKNAGPQQSQAVSFTLDKNTIETLSKVDSSFKNVDESTVNTLGSLVSILKAYESVNLTKISTNIIDPLNNIRNVDAKTLEKVIENLNEALNGKVKLSDVMLELSKPEYAIVLAEPKQSLQELDQISYILTLMAASFTEDKKNEVIRMLTALNEIISNPDNSLKSVITSYSFDAVDLSGTLESIVSLNEVIEAMNNMPLVLDATIEDSLKKMHDIMVSNETALKETFDSLAGLTPLKPDSAESFKSLEVILDEINKISKTAKPKNIDSVKTTLEIFKNIIDSGDGNGIKGVFDAINNTNPPKDIQDRLAPISDVAVAMQTLFTIDYSQFGDNAKSMADSLKELIKAIESIPDIDPKKSLAAKSKAILKEMTSYETNMDKALESQKKGMTSTKAILGNTEKMQDDIMEVSEEMKKTNKKENTLAVKGVANIVMAMGAMMLIGPMIAKNNPNFIQDAYRFGASLVVFTTMVMAPILLINKLSSTKNMVSIEGFGKMIFGLGMTLVIGAMFYSWFGPDFSKYVKQFTIDLTLFMIGISIPILLMKKSMDAERSAEGIAKLVTRCAIIMLIGAWFINADGGNLAKAALKFGVVLGMFILLTTLPLTLFALAAKNEMKSVEGIAKLITRCSLVMLLGALIVQNDQLVKSALRFGLVLGLFIAMVMAPIWLMSKSLRRDMIAIKRIGGLVLETSLILMIGGWFMTNQKLAKGALNFALLVSAFIFTITLGIAIGSKGITAKAIAFINNLTRIILATSLVLMVGGVFMTNQKLADGALRFALLVSAFTLVMALSLRLIGKTFNKKAIVGITQMILATTALSLILMFGTMFISTYGVENALMFVGVVALFTLAMMGIFTFIAKKAKVTAEAAGVILVMAISTAILGLALLAVHLAMRNFEWKELGIFLLAVAAMSAIFWLVGDKKVSQKVYRGARTAKGMALGIALLGLSLLLVNLAMKNFEWKELAIFLVAVAGLALVFGIIGVESLADKVGLGSVVAGLMAVAIGLLGVSLFIVKLATKNMSFAQIGLFIAAVAGLALVFGIIGIPYVAMVVGLGSIVATAMGVALMSLSIGLMLVCVLSKLPVKEGAKKLSEGILALMGTFSLMGLLMPLIVLGSVAGTLLGVSLITLSIGFTLLAALSMIKIDGKEIPLVEAAENLSTGIKALMGTFTLMGLLMPLIVLGSVAGVLLSAAIIPLSISFTLLAVLCKIKIGGEEINILDAIDNLTKALNKLMVPFTVLGLMLVPVILGSVTAATLSASLIALSAAFALLNLVTKPDIVSNVEKFNKALVGDGDKPGLVKIISGIGGVRTLAKVTMGTTVALELAVSISAVSIALSRMHDALEQSDVVSEVDTFGNVLSKLLKTFDASKNESPYHYIDFKSVKKTVKQVKNSIYPMIQISSDLFKVVKDFATLMIPTDWNKEGKAIAYTKLEEGDFVSASRSITSSIEALLLGFAALEQNPSIKALLDDVNDNTGVRGFFKRVFSGGKKGKSMLGAVIKATSMISQVVGNIGDNIVHFATLQIPDDWNNEGKAIHFRQLSDADFVSAASGIVKMLDVTMSGIVSFGNKYADVIEDFQKNDRGWLGLSKGKSKFSATLSVAGQIGEMVAGLAEGIQQYATLQIPDDWNKDGKPIHFRTLNEGDFVAVKANIKHIICGVTDAINSSGWVWPKHAKNITDAVTMCAKMLADVAKVIADYSALRIPVFKAGKLEPSSYRTLTPQDFTDFSTNVATILAAIPSAITAGAKATWKEGFYTSDIKYYSENFLPMTELLVNIVDAIKTYATLKNIPIMDKEGKIVKYIEIDFDRDISSMGTNVGKILTGMCTAIAFGYKMFEIFAKAQSGRDIEKIVEGIKPIGEIFTSLVEGVKSYADLKIPKYNKKGEVSGYVTLIDDPDNGFDKLFNKIGFNISRILNGMVSAITTAIELCDWIKSDDKRREMSKRIEVLGTIFEPITNTLNIMKTYSELKFPKGFDKNGKATGYYNITEFSTDNLQNTLSSLIQAIPNAIKSAMDAVSGTLNDLVSGGKLETFNEQFREVTQFITDDVLPTVKSYVEYKIPISFDKDGKPTKYYDLSKKGIEKLEETMSNIICAIPNAMHKSLEKVTLTDEEFIKLIKMSIIVKRASDILAKMYDTAETLVVKDIATQIKSYNDVLSNLSTNVLGTYDLLHEKLVPGMINIWETIDVNFAKGEYNETRRKEIMNLTSMMISDLYTLIDIITSRTTVTKGGIFGLFDNKDTNSYEAKIDNFAMITKKLFTVTGVLVLINDNLSKVEANTADNAKNMLSAIREESELITDENLQRLNKETRVVSKYVKALNSVKVKNVDSMTKWFEAMNRFAQSVGNLDKFTNTLAKKIAVVLDDFTKELRNAEKTIANADKIRKERQKTMEETLGKIQNIMGQTLNVSVSSSSGDSISGSQTYSES